MTPLILVLTCLLYTPSVLVVAAVGYQSPTSRHTRCERVAIPLCMDVQYNQTRMPNLVGHVSQSEASMQIHEFIPLIQFGCSRLLKFFLCSMYAPMCTVQVDETMVIPPCRSMCLQVKQRCEPILQRFNFGWPAMLNCSELPERGDRSNLCIDPPELEDELEKSAKSSSSILNHLARVSPEATGSSDSDLSKLLEIARKATGSWSPELLDGSLPKTKQTDTLGGGIATFKCSERYILIERRSSVFGNWSCSPRCKMDVLYKTDDKRYISTWIMIWASIALASSLFTLMTCLIDSSRFQYPQRPVIFMCISCSITSSVMLTCSFTQTGFFSCERTPEGLEFIVRGELEGARCMTIFVIMYFFSMSTAVWWVMLSITWFLSSAWKWGCEAIQSYASYFHLVAWTLPALKTIVILAIRKVDGDELTGSCYVGNQDSLALFTFVLMPIGVYLIVGVLLIAAGFLSLCRVRRNLRCRDLVVSGAMGDIRKLEKLIAKVGVFSAVYVVAQSLTFSCLIYEQLNQNRWISSSMSTPCSHHAIRGDLAEDHLISESSCDLKESIPPMWLFAAKFAASFSVGIANIIWVCSSKTLTSWKMFLCRSWTKDRSKNRQSFSNIAFGSMPRQHATVNRSFQKAYSQSSLYATLSRAEPSSTTIF